jgi:hypothetical protein
MKNNNILILIMIIDNTHSDSLIAYILLYTAFYRFALYSGVALF